MSDVSLSGVDADKAAAEPEALPAKPVYKIALGIEYDGSQYAGWQRQLDAPSVQECLEKR